LNDRFHRRRAESTFVILLSALTASLLLLIPGQGRVAVGIEMLLIGVFLVYRAAHTWPIVRASLRREAVISYPSAHPRMCSSAWARSASWLELQAAFTSSRRRSCWSSFERCLTSGCSSAGSRRTRPAPRRAPTARSKRADGAAAARALHLRRAG